MILYVQSYIWGDVKIAVHKMIRYSYCDCTDYLPMTSNMKIQIAIEFNLDLNSVNVLYWIILSL